MLANQRKGLALMAGVDLALGLRRAADKLHAERPRTITEP